MKKLLSFLIAVLLTISIYATPDDFEIIKKRVIAELMKTRVDESDVEGILARMKSDGSFNDINYADLSRTAGFPHRFLRPIKRAR